MVMESLLLLILVGLAIAAVRSRDLLVATSILGAYSLVIALLWCVMDALDVGFTEAAVGAGISTVLMLAAINRIGRREATAQGPVLKPTLFSMQQRREQLQQPDTRRPRLIKVGAVVLCLLVAMALLYGAQDMPQVGDPDAPANSNPDVAQRYIRDAMHPDASKNIVTTVLGDYRGYDTMGETVVIFTAALCVLLLLRQAPMRREDEGGTDAD
ncbi:MAG: DUF4040 domain-containing protein [Planctomycetota bacterium]|nr:DUF4040 domain-containing protein [Planctomycetota bacterium]